MQSGRRLISFILLSFALSLFLPVPKNAIAADTPLRTSGKIMLLGGAMEDNNSEVYTALKNAACITGSTPKIAVICSASPGYADALHVWSIDDPGSVSYQHLFQNYGFYPVFIPVAIDNYAVESYKQENVDLVKSCDAVFFNGGWQERHTRCMFTDNGKDTPVMAAVRDVYNKGGVISGTSAGCAVMGELTYGAGNSYGYLKANHMIEKSISDVNVDDPDNPDNGGYIKGFGFTSPYDALCDSHFEAQGRFTRPIVAMRELGKTAAFGVDENTALLLSGDTGKVYGENGITVFDSSSAIFNTSEYFTADNILVSYLTSGDSYSFSTKSVNSSKPAAVLNSKVYNSSKIFSPYEASKVMATLVRSSSKSAVGYSQEKYPRFTVTFSKTANTRGYYDPNTGKYAIDKLAISITYQKSNR